MSRSAFSTMVAVEFSRNVSPLTSMYHEGHGEKYDERFGEL